MQGRLCMNYIPRHESARRGENVLRRGLEVWHCIPTCPRGLKGCLDACTCSLACAFSFSCRRVSICRQAQMISEEGSTTAIMSIKNNTKAQGQHETHRVWEYPIITCCCSALSHLLSIFGLELDLGELPAKHSCSCRAKWSAREAWDLALSIAL